MTNDVIHLESIYNSYFSYENSDKGVWDGLGGDTKHWHHLQKPLHHPQNI